MQRITGGSVRLVERWLPDPLVFCFILTLVVFVAGLLVERETPARMIEHWGDGFWNLLTFAMQMVLILVTGFVLASSAFFKRILAALAGLAKSPGQAIMLVTVVSMCASWINWGFGLVIGALFARQLARRVARVDYRLLIASAYSGFIVWHGGLAGSVPLTVATDGHFMAERIGIIGTGETIFTAFNLVIVLVLLIVMPLINRLMMPPADQTVTVDPKKLAEEEPAPIPSDRTPAQRMDDSLLLAQAVGIMGVVFAAYYFLAQSGTLNLNIVNFMFLFLGIVLHGRPSRFLAAVNEAVKGASGIIVQFPFYAGIMGMMIGSGLATSLSELFVSISSSATLPVFTFLSAGLVNIFVPSGGGQWAVQAPVMVPAALELGAQVPRVAMAVAWGDAWTNLIQPFWALPALAIAGLRARDIMGYCLVLLIITGVLISLGLWLLP
ncbi:short-chain fatty acid transporter [Alkalilimnicola sp. S0819]|uniref:short-chain fatty acid transporter n=1 Tax=Alkalilimnicola sp. S0819 TaxID=2613922 RepID=UPI001261479A|nr:short-chain fatty acid transporter [Alkalilimnicola sp. S0819]KAB7627272.1 short-chain fatty acid transporter [Alkalilimnicola sp. S0819]MPQ15985.1 short-chain fatty acid transporter [Alkalilimnicola sp. S0819]